MPNMAHMKSVKQLVPSVQGDIAFEINRSDADIIMTLETPDNTTALMGIPKQYFEIGAVTLNGDTVWTRGQAPRGESRIAQGVRFMGADEKYLTFEVKAGNWKFRAQP